MKVTLPQIALAMAILGAGMGMHIYNSNALIQDIGKWVALISLLWYLGAFAIGMGATPWTVNSEIYPL